MPAKRREDIDDDEVRYLYNVEHWSQREIARYLGVPRSTILYRLDPEKLKGYMKKYQQTDKYKEYTKKYFQTDEGKAAIKKYQQTEKGIAAKKRFWQTENGKILRSIHKAKRRELGFIPVNQPFPNSHAHHIDFNHVIYMPAELHKSIWHNVFSGVGMEEINEVAFGYITEEEFERLESGELDK